METEPTDDNSSVVTDLTPVLELLTKPKLAEFYAALREQPSTIPALLPDLSIGKTAAYDYRDRLEAAGLIAEVGSEDNSTVYEAYDFDITMQLGSEEFRVTPALARILAERTENPEVDRFVDQYGVATLAEFIPLARTYAEGKLTHRAIAERLDISRASAFEMLGEVLAILDITPESKHSSPGDLSDDDVAAIIENARSSE